MMTQLVDFYHDTDQVVFAHIRQNTQLPPFMVNHRAMSDKDLEKLDAREFADPIHRMFPICSAAETWKSVAYFNVLKQAALSLESAQEREGIRTMLMKAASLWGLTDQEVQDLAKNVTLRKTAESEPSAKQKAAEFLRSAFSMSAKTRQQEAEVLLKAAEADLEPEARTQLLRHAGAATCTAGDAVKVLNRIVSQVPFRSPYRETLHEMRETLRKHPESELLDPAEATDLTACVEVIVNQYHIHNAQVENLRSFTMADAEALKQDADDQVKLPGGIYARKSAVAENAPRLSIHLSNLHSVEAHRPEEILAALQKLSPTEILPFRPLIGA